MERKQLFTNKAKNALLRVLSLLLLLSLSAALCSCKKVKNREFDEAEVLAAAKELVSASVFLNNVYFGSGIPYLDEDERNNGIYKIADTDFLSEHEIETVDKLKEKTSAVYTEALAGEIFSTKFSSVGDEDGIRVLSRYYQRYEDTEKKILGGIMVNSSATVFFEEPVIYDFDRMTVIGSVGDIVKLSLPITVSDGEHSSERTITVSLFEEETGWRLASHTYAKYSADFDEYEKRKENK